MVHIDDWPHFITLLSFELSPKFFDFGIRQVILIHKIFFPLDKAPDNWGGVEHNRHIGKSDCLNRDK